MLVFLAVNPSSGGGAAAQLLSLGFNYLQLRPPKPAVEYPTEDIRIPKSPINGSSHDRRNEPGNNEGEPLEDNHLDNICLATGSEEDNCLVQDVSDQPELRVSPPLPLREGLPSSGEGPPSDGEKLLPSRESLPSIREKLPPGKKEQSSSRKNLPSNRNGPGHQGAPSLDGPGHQGVPSSDDRKPSQGAVREILGMMEDSPSVRDALALWTLPDAATSRGDSLEVAAYATFDWEGLLRLHEAGGIPAHGVAAPGGVYKGERVGGRMGAHQGTRTNAQSRDACAVEECVAQALAHSACSAERCVAARATQSGSVHVFIGDIRQGADGAKPLFRLLALVSRQRGVRCRLLCAGGDGTLMWAINCLRSHAVGPEVAVGIVPFGTGNDFARAAGCLTNPFAVTDRRPRLSLERGSPDGKAVTTKASDTGTGGKARGSGSKASGSGSKASG
ncbi:diacylglycerol kinase, partial [Gregarina niphandrodes]